MIDFDLQKLPKNEGDLDKLIVAKGFKKLPKVQKIAQSGHTGGKVKEAGLVHIKKICLVKLRYGMWLYLKSAINLKWLA